MPKLTKAQLAMSIEELTADLVSLRDVKHQDVVDKAKKGHSDALITKQSAIDGLLAIEEERIKEEMDIIHDPLIETALQALRDAEKAAVDAGATIEAPVVKGKSTNPKHHLMWCGPKYGKWLLKYREAHPKHTMDQLISDYNEYKTGGPLKNPHLKNNIAVAGWSDNKVKEAIELVYSCDCCSDKDRPKRK